MLRNYMWVLCFFTGWLTLLYLILYTIFSRRDLINRLYLGKTKKNVKYSKETGLFYLLNKSMNSKVQGFKYINIFKSLDKAITVSGIKWDLGNILLVKFFLALLFPLFAIILIRNVSNNIKIILVMFTVFIGFMIPNIIIKSKVKKRKKAISKKLPSFIDYLTIVVEAGSGLDQAIMRVLSKIQGPLAEEIAYTMTEIKYGKYKKNAFDDLTKRIDIPEMTKFINTLINGEQLGISLAKILTNQGQQIRENRKQQMREKAYKIPVKLLFPLVFFILPTIFIVILGPAGIQLMENY